MFSDELKQQRLELIIKKAKQRINFSQDDGSDPLRKRMQGAKSSKELQDVRQQMQKLNAFGDPQIVQNLQDVRNLMITKMELQDQLIRQMSLFSVPEYVSEEDFDHKKLAKNLRLEFTSNELYRCTSNSVMKDSMISKQMKRIDQNNRNRIPIIDEDEENFYSDRMEKDIEEKQKQDFSEGLNFYQRVFQDNKKCQSLKSQKNDFQIINYKKQIQDYQKHYGQQGIDLDSNSLIINQKYCRKFQDKANTLINQMTDDKLKQMKNKTFMDDRLKQLSATSKLLIAKNKKIFSRTTTQNTRTAIPQVPQQIKTYTYQQKSKILEVPQPKDDIIDLNILEDYMMQMDQKYKKQSISLKFDEKDLLSYLKDTQQLRQSYLYNKKKTNFNRKLMML